MTPQIGIAAMRGNQWMSLDYIEVSTYSPALMAPRLDAEERRGAILATALPLFAAKGFAATTTKEIAAAAGVSEALIFRHFPSKAALYDALIRCSIEGDAELERLAARPPSTKTLVQLVRGLATYFLVELPADPEGRRARHRLRMASLLEDGEFARLAYDWLHEEIEPIFAASLGAAEAAGELVASPVAPRSRFLFAEHLGSMLAAVRLPGGEPPSQQPETAADLVEAASWFILRGIGLTDAAIDAHLRTPALVQE
jgi:TetR/AcrR family transcriptional regulator, transcriptional repressor of aconitase